MMNVIAILAIFTGLALVAALPLVIMINFFDPKRPVKDVTPHEPR
jgi:hypothetical protein